MGVKEVLRVRVRDGLNVRFVGSTLKSLLPRRTLEPLRRFKRNWLLPGTKSYSQEGEDVLLSSLLEGTDDGFYVDVGAHHPVILSNTYRFYRQGWRGINIDPLPGTEKLFKVRRPRDITLELGISAASGTMPFYIFDKSNWATFGASDRDFALSRGCRLVQTRNVRVERLDSILRNHLPSGQKIDFMTIDVEGHELHVLESNDWERYRPKIIVLEIRLTPFEQMLSHPLTVFLRTRDYGICSKLHLSAFFRDVR